MTSARASVAQHATYNTAMNGFVSPHLRYASSSTHVPSSRLYQLCHLLAQAVVGPDARQPAFWRCCGEALQSEHTDSFKRLGSGSHQQSHLLPSTTNMIQFACNPPPIACTHACNSALRASSDAVKFSVRNSHTPVVARSLISELHPLSVCSKLRHAPVAITAAGAQQHLCTYRFTPCWNSLWC